MTSEVQLSTENKIEVFNALLKIGATPLSMMPLRITTLSITKQSEM
jgi:hypothetical protein